MSGRARSTRPRRLAAVSGVAVAIGATGAILTAGTAHAANPIVVGSCGATVQGAAGTPVSLSLGNLLGVATLPTIPIGTIGSGTGQLNAIPQITAALNKIPLAGSLLTGLLRTGCEITTKAVNTAGAPVQPVTRGVGSAVDHGAQQLGSLLQPKQPGNPGNPGTPGNQSGPTSPGNPGTAAGVEEGTPPPLGLPSYRNLVGTGVPFNESLVAEYGSALSPQQRYGDIPFATPGLFSMSPGVRYGGQIPGYSPQFQPLAGQGSSDNPVRTAGRAKALQGSDPAAGTVGLPLLLAVLGFAAVTAALVRTWVLRKTLSSPV